MDNPKQDIPLLTVLRSEIFEFSIEELTAVRIAHKTGSYYQALAACAGENLSAMGDAAGADCRAQADLSGNAGDVRQAADISGAGKGAGSMVDAALREKCASVLQRLRTWSQLAMLLPLDELIWELLLETGFYIAMGAMPSGSSQTGESARAGR